MTNNNLCKKITEDTNSCNQVCNKYCTTVDDILYMFDEITLKDIILAYQKCKYVCDKLGYDTDDICLKDNQMGFYVPMCDVDDTTCCYDMYNWSYGDDPRTGCVLDCGRTYNKYGYNCNFGMCNDECNGDIFFADYAV